ncbi:chaperone DnaJ-domain superfamily protein [Actinidia rufa]|uniref:Chaperone DnaJ-domain superfamily protein n=1 Tax=Actinidia rufa TaxID=165716 RepID=A0A7J0G8S7_9ERIC|nr:chaperone DnaJ-domain superfamily protein [Actinidia rufa]
MMSEEQTHKSKKSVDAWIKLNKSVSRVLETVLFRNLGKWVRFGDVRLSISGFDGFRVSKDVHRRVLADRSLFFAENLLLRSTVAAVEICDCYHVEGYVETVVLIFKLGKCNWRWHPDRWARNSTVAEDANRRFQKIQEAYSVLSDEGKRSIYDAGVLDMFDEDEVPGEFGGPAEEFHGNVRCRSCELLRERRKKRRLRRGNATEHPMPRRRSATVALAVRGSSVIRIWRWE